MILKSEAITEGHRSAQEGLIQVRNSCRGHEANITRRTQPALFQSRLSHLYSSLWNLCGAERGMKSWRLQRVVSWCERAKNVLQVIYRRKRQLGQFPKPHTAMTDTSSLDYLNIWFVAQVWLFQNKIHAFKCTEWTL